MKKKIVYIAPHLSTGGMPQYLYKQMELLVNDFEIYCVEWGDVTGGVLVVQRNKIKSLLGERLLTLGERKEDVFEMIKRINPDVIHLQEIPELFIPHNIAERIYSKDRKYSIIETSHDSSHSAKSKRFFPDKFLFVSQYQVGLYKELGIPSDVVEYPIEYFARTKTREEAQRELGMDPNLKHIINVGLFTPRKNQAEIVEYAKALKDYPVQFHFIGNQADNFKFYWEPIMKEFPSNCKWWNERTDVDTFYQAADLFLFTSRGSETDKETMPLVIREAISWQVSSLIYNLSVYENYFDKYDTIKYLDFTSIKYNTSKIINELHMVTTTNKENSRLSKLLTEKRLSFYDDCGGVNELYGLRDLIKENFHSNFVIAEIGSFEGKSTELLALNCAKVYSIDPYLPYDEINPIHMKIAESKFLSMAQNYSNIEKICKKSLEAAESFKDNYLDAVYIDGAHDYINVKADILAWLPKVKEGGIICGHDYTTTESIQKAVREVFPQSEIKTYIDSSWAVKKIKNESDKEIYILSTYPNVTGKEKLLNDTVNKLKKLGKDVLIASHYPIPDYIVEKVDYYIYDSNNLKDTTRTLQKNGPDYWEEHSNFRIECVFTNHITSLSRIFSIALDFVSNLGYQNFFIIETDAEYDIDDIKQFGSFLEKMKLKNKKLIFFKPKHIEFNWFNESVYESYCFGGNVKEFLYNLKFPRTIDEWENLIKDINTPTIALEQILYRTFHKNEENYLILGTLKSVFRNSKIDLFTNSNKFGIFYNINNENTVILYFTNYEVDEIEYRFVAPYAMYREKILKRNTWAYEVVDLHSEECTDIKIEKYIHGELVAEVHERLTKENIKELAKYRTIKFS